MTSDYKHGRINFSTRLWLGRSYALKQKMVIGIDIFDRILFGIGILDPFLFGIDILDLFLFGIDILDPDLFGRSTE